MLSISLIIYPIIRRHVRLVTYSVVKFHTMAQAVSRLPESVYV
jgi:hypothetical protein